MNYQTRLSVQAFAMVLLMFGVTAVNAQPVSGPDVIVGGLIDVQNYGSNGQIAGFAIGTESCNIGNQNLLWIASTPAHPVIGQNLYRLSNGRMEQIGMSWLKHGFTALTLNLCSPCNGQGGSVLGVGCSDPYVASLNGSQNSLGARSEVNAATGVFPYPRIHVPPFPAIIGRRVQAHHADLDPALNPGARYFVEGQYITQDDAAAGNDNNNASYREVTVSQSGNSYSLTLIGPTVQTKSAVQAWADIDSTVMIQHVDIPNDGRVTIAQKVDFIGGGLMRVTYAVHNLNSDRSIGGFEVEQTPGFNVSGNGFHDVDYHSNEVFNGTDWNFTTAANGVMWQTAQTHAQNQNANALRWGSAYTFWFDTDTPPGDLTLHLFKPGTPNTMTVSAIPFPAPSWQVNGPKAHLDIDGATNSAMFGPINVNKFIAEQGSFNYSSTLTGNLYDIAISAAPALPNVVVTPGDQRVNVDLSQPVLWLNGFFQAGMPASPVSIPFATPGGTYTMQMLVLDPGSTDGFALSAAVQLTGTAAPAPTISNITPASATAGTQISVNGTGFLQGASISVGGAPVSTTYVSENTLTFPYPSNVPCDTALVVTNPDSQIASGTLNPTPTITNPVSPTGSAAGGQTFVIFGTGFAPGTTVTFNATPATVITASYSVVICIVPAGTAGTTATVQFTTPGGCSVTTPYVYQ